MKTTIDIPDVKLSETMRLIAMETKREAVGKALNGFNSRRRMARLVRHSGTRGLPSDTEMRKRARRQTGVTLSASPEEVNR